METANIRLAWLSLADILRLAWRCNGPNKDETAQVRSTVRAAEFGTSNGLGQVGNPG